MLENVTLDQKAPLLLPDYRDKGVLFKSIDIF
jgi:hypothetical protein